MFRLLFITFTGQFRGTEEQRHHLHESPAVMTIPLIILAILSVIGGWIGIPELIVKGGDKFAEFLAPVIPIHHAIGEAHPEMMLMLLSTAAVVIAILFAWFLYRNYREKETKGFGKILENKWYVDELFDKVIVSPIQRFAGFLNKWIENMGIDRIVNGVGKTVQYGSRQLRLLQSGQVGSYVLLMVLAMLVIFAIQFFLRK
jgi:NADH-quinone oxidoreductase subunit L